MKVNCFLAVFIYNAVRITILSGEEIVLSTPNEEVEMRTTDLRDQKFKNWSEEGVDDINLGRFICGYADDGTCGETCLKEYGTQDYKCTSNNRECYCQLEKIDDERTTRNSKTENESNKMQEKRDEHSGEKTNILKPSWDSIKIEPDELKPSLFELMQSTAEKRIVIKSRSKRDKALVHREFPTTKNPKLQERVTKKNHVRQRITKKRKRQNTNKTATNRRQGPNKVRTKKPQRPKKPRKNKRQRHKPTRNQKRQRERIMTGKTTDLPVLTTIQISDRKDVSTKEKITHQSIGETESPKSSFQPEPQTKAIFTTKSPIEVQIQKQVNVEMANTKNLSGILPADNSLKLDEYLSSMNLTKTNYRNEIDNKEGLQRFPREASGKTSSMDETKGNSKGRIIYLPLFVKESGALYEPSSPPKRAKKHVRNDKRGVSYKSFNDISRHDGSLSGTLGREQSNSNQYVVQFNSACAKSSERCKKRCLNWTVNQNLEAYYCRNKKDCICVSKAVITDKTSNCDEDQCINYYPLGGNMRCRSDQLSFETCKAICSLTFQSKKLFCSDVGLCFCINTTSPAQHLIKPLNPVIVHTGGCASVEDSCYRYCRNTMANNLDSYHCLENNDCICIAKRFKNDVSQTCDVVRKNCVNKFSLGPELQCVESTKTLERCTYICRNVVSTSGVSCDSNSKCFCFLPVSEIPTELPSSDDDYIVLMDRGGCKRGEVECKFFCRQEMGDSKLYKAFCLEDQNCVCVSQTFLDNPRVTCDVSTELCESTYNMGQLVKCWPTPTDKQNCRTICFNTLHTTEFICDASQQCHCVMQVVATTDDVNVQPQKRENPPLQKAEECGPVPETKKPRPPVSDRPRPKKIPYPPTIRKPEKYEPTTQQSEDCEPAPVPRKPQPTALDKPTLSKKPSRPLPPKPEKCETSVPSTTQKPEDCETAPEPRNAEQSISDKPSKISKSDNDKPLSSIIAKPGQCQQGKDYCSKLCLELLGRKYDGAVCYKDDCYCVTEDLKNNPTTTIRRKKLNDYHYPMGTEINCNRDTKSKNACQKICMETVGTLNVTCDDGGLCFCNVVPAKKVESPEPRKTTAKPLDWPMIVFLPDACSSKKKCKKSCKERMPENYGYSICNSEQDCYCIAKNFKDGEELCNKKDVCVIKFPVTPELKCDKLKRHMRNCVFLCESVVFTKDVDCNSHGTCYCYKIRKPLPADVENELIDNNYKDPVKVFPDGCPRLNQERCQKQCVRTYGTKLAEYICTHEGECFCGNQDLEGEPVSRCTSTGCDNYHPIGENVCLKPGSAAYKACENMCEKIVGTVDVVCGHTNYCACLVQGPPKEPTTPVPNDTETPKPSKPTDGPLYRASQPANESSKPEVKATTEWTYVPQPQEEPPIESVELLSLTTPPSSKIAEPFSGHVFYFKNLCSDKTNGESVCSTQCDKYQQKIGSTFCSKLGHCYCVQVRKKIRVTCAGSEHPPCVVDIKVSKTACDFAPEDTQPCMETCKTLYGNSSKFKCDEKKFCHCLIDID